MTSAKPFTMASDNESGFELDNLTITHPITARRVKRGESLRGCYKILLLGTTGSGKSTFIETLCPSSKPTLAISGNTLESVTQSLQEYFIDGITPSPTSSNPAQRIVLIDTPGMADDKISENAVVNGVVGWLYERTHFINHIIYFDRITDVRMGGNRKRAIELFKLLSGVQAAGNVTIATTMWDQLGVSDAGDGVESSRGEERRKKGETAMNKALERFEELRRGYWESFTTSNTNPNPKSPTSPSPSNPTPITKFINTQPSALHILNTAVSRYSIDTNFEVEKPAKTAGNGVVRMPFGRVLYEGLRERLERLKMRGRGVEEEIEGMSGGGVVQGEGGVMGDLDLNTEDRDELLQLLMKEKEDVEFMKGRVEYELSGFGPVLPPEWGIENN
ncbi:hypothetical protein CVT24_005469 [Panaeolus cyanescens]|uniref:G domain-containing protein n=1 Tax=Panaeolus cyanescens TaxID=181874 RepID=A0A409YC29_9AGAR|nr:hypothetical protein CVT24_005469 [Panaeolus cyanescens]